LCSECKPGGCPMGASGGGLPWEAGGLSRMVEFLAVFGFAVCDMMFML
jgi:hypothetical protein